MISSAALRAAGSICRDNKFPKIPTKKADPKRASSILVKQSRVHGKDDGCVQEMVVFPATGHNNRPRIGEAQKGGFHRTYPDVESSKRETRYPRDGFHLKDDFAT